MMFTVELCALLGERQRGEIRPGVFLPGPSPRLRLEDFRPYRTRVSALLLSPGHATAVERHSCAREIPSDVQGRRVQPAYSGKCIPAVRLVSSQAPSLLTFPSAANQ